MFKAVIIFFLCLGLALLGFCYWGLKTAAGQAALPEMAGMLAYYAGGMGAAIVLLSSLILFSRYLRQRRTGR